MKKRPVIGIPYIGSAAEHHYMLGNYVFALLRAGARPKILRRTSDPTVFQTYLQVCDGFLMPGGPDIDPSRYGREKEPECGEIDPERDAFELQLLEWLLPTQKPILGICRGCQALAVASGGTLLQDITKQQGCNHKNRENLRKAMHLVTLDGDSILRDILPETENTYRVNTWHHQVVEQPGQGMRIIAYSPDGFAEAIQRDDRAFCLGVQWHPEHLILRDKNQQHIFNAFIEACR